MQEVDEVKTSYVQEPAPFLSPRRPRNHQSVSSDEDDDIPVKQFGVDEIDPILGVPKSQLKPVTEVKG